MWRHVVRSFAVIFRRKSLASERYENWGSAPANGATALRGPGPPHYRDNEPTQLSLAAHSCVMRFVQHTASPETSVPPPVSEEALSTALHIIVLTFPTVASVTDSSSDSSSVICQRFQMLLIKNREKYSKRKKFGNVFMTRNNYTL